MLPKSKYFDFYLYAVDKNDSMQKQFIEKGTFDYIVSEWIVENVKKNWIIYDVGANLFEYTELFARKSGKNGIVHAFEPQKDLVKGYKIAQKYNNYSDAAEIKIYQVALTNKNSNIKLQKSNNHSGLASLISDQVDINKDLFDNVEIVKAVRADSPELNLSKTIPDLLKLDIEGAEESFWEGAPDFLKKSKRILAEVTHNTTSSNLIKEYLKDRYAYSIHTKRLLSSVDDILKEVESQPYKQSNIVFTNKILN